MSTPAPSVRSLLIVALPLIFSGLASNLAIFVDRIILSFYDAEMMAHVTAVSNYCWMILYLTGGITYISKVFVGRFNGQGEYHMAAQVAWQMIFFSLGCLSIFLLSYAFSFSIVPQFVQKHGLLYFKVIMLGGIFWPLVGGLSSFFIGTYQIRVVFTALMIANISNIVLDFAWIPSMGAYGAALATITAMALQAGYLFLHFFKAYNREKYQTLSITYNSDLMYQCILIGYPESLSHFFEMMAWALVITIISAKGNTYMLVSTIAQNLFILFMFAYTELGNAVKTMCSNYIGEDRASHIPKLASSAFLLHTAFILTIASVLLLRPSLLLSLFSLGDESLYLQTLVIYSLKGVLLFMFFDGIAYIIASILSAYGDTFASMVIMTGTMWLFMVVPTYLIMALTTPSPTMHSSILLPIYGLITALCYAWRYQTAQIKSIIAPVSEEILVEEEL